MVIFTTEVAIDDVWWHLTINEVTWVTLVQPCCTQKREQFECCRCRPRSASFKLFSLLSLFTFVTFPRLLSPISTLLDFSSETSSFFLITSLLLVFTTVHDLTLWDLLLKSSLWNCKIEEGFCAFQGNMCDQAFLWWHTFSQCAEFPPEMLRVQHPRFCRCTIPHNLRRLIGFSLQCRCRAARWKCVRETSFELRCEASLACCEAQAQVLRSFSLKCNATSPLFRDCSMWQV